MLPIEERAPNGFLDGATDRVEAAPKVPSSKHRQEGHAGRCQRRYSGDDRWRHAQYRMADERVGRIGTSSSKQQHFMHWCRRQKKASEKQDGDEQWYRQRLARLTGPWARRHCFTPCQQCGSHSRWWSQQTTSHFSVWYLERMGPHRPEGSRIYSTYAQVPG